MARGAKGKAPDDRARRNADSIPTTTVEFVAAAQPNLSSRMPGGEAWPRHTREWWKLWARDPRAKRFDAAAWQYLLDTAVVHGRLWSGDIKAAPELRLRLERFGVTPGDRARLRVQLTDGLEGAPAASPVEPAQAEPTGARARFGGLKVVGGKSAAEN